MLRRRRRQELIVDRGEVRNRYIKKRINFDEYFSDFQFKESFRLMPETVEYILQFVGPHLTNITGRSKALDARHRVLLALHWMGNGSQMHGVGETHGISKATVSRVVRKFVDAIISTMFQSHVRWPDDTSNIAPNVLRKGGFPCVSGCVDGTLINIDAPTIHEEVYVDHKGNHSLNVMVICGPNYEFYSVNSNWPGSTHDSRVLRNSAVCRVFNDGWRPFPGAVILGDSTYGLKDWLIPPINRNPDNNVEIRFNRAHKRTRRLVENSIGILKERFLVMNHMCLHPVSAAKVVLACITLHNVAKHFASVEPVSCYGVNMEDEDYNDDVSLEEICEDPPAGGAINRLNGLMRFFE